MTLSSGWPEPPAERQARKRRVQKAKRKAKEPAEIDTRTPSGKPLPY